MRTVKEAAPDRREFTRTCDDLARWRQGEAAAFQDLWRRYEPGLRLIVAGKIRNVRSDEVRKKLEADDIVQDVAAIVVSKLGEFEYRGPGSLYGWLEQIAERKVWDCVDYWEAARRDAGQELALDSRGRVSDPPHSGPGPATRAVMNERFTRLTDAIALASDRDRAIVLLRYFFGATWEEVAREVGAPSDDAVRKELSGRILPSLGFALDEK